MKQNQHNFLFDDMNRCPTTSWTKAGKEIACDARNAAILASGMPHPLSGWSMAKCRKQWNRFFRIFVLLFCYSAVKAMQKMHLYNRCK